MNLTVNDFIALVTDWAEANVDRIRAVWPLAGGWEAWAQAEIAGYINGVVMDTWIEREARVYPGQARCDFLVNNPFQNPPANEVVVELKCESLRNWAAFVDGLRYDVWKLNGPMTLGLAGASKVSLGLFFTPETEEQLAMLLGYNVNYIAGDQLGVAVMSWQDEPVLAQVPGAGRTQTTTTPGRRVGR